MSKLIRYQVAVSLDGFIAAPGGDNDWIVMDPAIDFAALFALFDTALMGRKTYQMMIANGGTGAMPGLDVIVFSKTLPAATHKGVVITNDDPRAVAAALKKRPGKDVWLFGGGELFRTLLDAGLVDSVEVAVIPVLLGSGVTLLPPGASTKLVLADHTVLQKSGIVVLSYALPRSKRYAPDIAIRFLRKPKAKSPKTAARKTAVKLKPRVVKRSRVR